jgi:hypothetical protein
MKKEVKPMQLKMLIMLLLFNIIQVALWAQESSSTTSSGSKTDVTVTTDHWYASPWVWVVGAAVFILLLVALLGGGRGRSSETTSDRVTVTKTVERDTDV